MPRVVTVVVGTLLIARAAAAQPTFEPAPTEPAPSDPAAPIDPAAPVAPAAPWSPISDDGWPWGVSLEAMRALPECGPGGLRLPDGSMPRGGEPIPCRPAIIPTGPQFGYGLDWTQGATFGGVPTTGAAHAWGIEVMWAATRSVSLGPRYELGGVGTPSGGRNDTIAHLDQHLLAVAKHRFWTDEVDRDAWTLSVGAGYAIRGDALGGSAPMARIGIAREVGLYGSDTLAGTGAIEVAYEQSFGSERLSALLASLRFGMEWGIREPLNLGTPDEPAPIKYTVSGDFYGGPALGLGMTVGLRASPMWSLETSGTFMFGRTDGATEHGFDGATWALMSGPRMTLPRPAFAPVYLQVQAGPAWVARDPERETTWLGQGELGLRFLVGCGDHAGVDLGAWVRADVADGIDVTAGGMVLRLVIGSRAGAPGGHPVFDDGRDHCAPEAPRFATEPPPPPPPPAPPPPPTPVDGGAVGGQIDAHVEVDAHVQVEIKPVVIDVTLGAVLFGGAVRVQIDPRILPLARLPGAGWVTVLLSGPPEALASFRAELGATLDRNGARVDGWAEVATAARAVTARFTIWPPGTRPPAP
ncbi:MAG: hypothetical protein K8W52_45415 [Deltaproteobacteria bacterium]|nr:hypothetical protein [Deltaproteobacteria bacterium]